MSSSLPKHEYHLISAKLAKSASDASSARARLDECLGLKKDCFEALVLRGQMEWEAGESGLALPWFLKAAKVKPSNPMPFLYLGR